MSRLTREHDTERACCQLSIHISTSSWSPYLPQQPSVISLKHVIFFQYVVRRNSIINYYNLRAQKKIIIIILGQRKRIHKNKKIKHSHEITIFNMIQPTLYLHLRTTPTKISTINDMDYYSKSLSNHSYSSRSLSPLPCGRNFG